MQSKSGRDLGNSTQISVALKLYSLWYQQGSLQGLAENTNLRHCAGNSHPGLRTQPPGFYLSGSNTNIYELQIQEKLDLKD